MAHQIPCQKKKHKNTHNYANASKQTFACLNLWRRNKTKNLTFDSTLFIIDFSLNDIDAFYHLVSFSNAVNHGSK